MPGTPAHRLRRLLPVAALALCVALVPVGPAAASPAAEGRSVDVVALDRAADGAGIVATLSYVCDPFVYSEVSSFAQVSIAQRLPGGAVARSGASGRAVLACTGERRTAYVGLHADGGAFRFGIALVSATHVACDDRDCITSYDQAVLPVRGRAVPAHRQAAEGQELVLAQSATLVGGGSGVALTVRLRCDAPGPVRLTTSLTQWVDPRLVHGSLPFSPVPCGTTWRDQQIVVAADGGLQAGAAFVSVYSDDGPHVHRTVAIVAPSVPALAHEVAAEGPPAQGQADGSDGTVSADAAAEVEVESVMLQAGGAAALVRLTVTCSVDLYYSYLFVTVSQRLPDGSLATAQTERIMTACEGQPQTMRLGLVDAPFGVERRPFVAGTALVEARLGDLEVAEQVTVGAERGVRGRNEGAFEFYLRSTGRLVAGGVGLQVEVVVRCTGPDYARLTVSQLQGTRVVTGREFAYVGCVGSQWKTFRVAAFADDGLFGAHPTFVSLDLGWEDAYQGVSEEGHAARTVAVDP